MSRLSTRAKVITHACETHSFWLLSAASALYFIIVGLTAAQKELENDELFTLYISRLPTMGHVWSALLTGAEQLPPFFYVVTRALLRLFGESPLTLRLPAILGVWVMALCLYKFVSKRSTPLYGLVAMLFSLTTNACYYAFEARPYGLVLAFAGIALVCWQSLLEKRSSLLPLVGLGLSLAAAVSSHYYGVLVLIPFGFGEIARTVSRRKIDFRVWIVLVLSLTPLLAVLPLIEAARAYSGSFWAQPRWGNFPDFYFFLLRSAELPFAAILILAVLYQAIFPDDREPVNDRRFGLLGNEVVVAVGFLTIPLVAVTMAVLVTGAFVERYALPAVIGLSVLMPFAFQRLLPRRPLLMLMLILLLAAGFSRRWGLTLSESSDKVQRREAVIKMIEEDNAKDLPIVASDQHLFLALAYYGSPDIRSRLVYLADPQASMRYLGHESLERGMMDLLKPWFRLNVQRYSPYIASQRSFLLCGDPQYFLNWVLQDLVSSHAHLELRGRQQEFLLFRVSAD